MVVERRKWKGKRQELLFHHSFWDCGLSVSEVLDRGNKAMKTIVLGWQIGISELWRGIKGNQVMGSILVSEKVEYVEGGR